MFSMVFRSMKKFYSFWKEYLFFIILYLILSSFIFIPFLGIFLQRFLLFIGSGVLLNTHVFRLLVDPWGLLGLFMLTAFTLFFVFIEYGTLVILAHKHYFNKKVLVMDSLTTTILSAKRILGIGMFPLAFLLLLFLPLLELPASSDTLHFIQVPGIFMDSIMAHPLSQALYWLMLAIFAYLLLRSIFTLHIMILKKKKAFAAIKESFTLSHKKTFSNLLKLIFFDVLLFFVATSLFSLFAVLPRWFNFSGGYILNELLSTFIALLTSLFLLFLLPLNILFITELYYNAPRNQEAKDRLQVRTVPFFASLEKRLFDFLDKKRVALPLLIVSTLLLSFVFGFAVNQNTLHAGRDIMVISHRAVVSGEFENSLRGIQASLDEELDMVEFDIQLTKDHKVIIHHDRTLRRTFGVPYSIGDLTLEELLNLPIEKPEEFLLDDPLLPTLKDALMLIDGNMKMLIDVKTHNDASEMAYALTKELGGYPYRESIYVQSFDQKFLEKFKIKNPDIPTSQILYISIGQLSRLSSDDLTLHRSMLSHELVRNARMEGKRMFVWPLNDEESIKEALQYDIDGIITSDPLLVNRILGRGPFFE